MAFTPLENPFHHIRSLPDRPKLSDGYTPDLLKAEFDRAGMEIRDYLNDTLLPELQGSAAGKSGAESIGSSKIDDLKEGSIHSQLAALNEKCHSLKDALTDAASGLLPPESITFEQLDADTQDRIDQSYLRSYSQATFASPGTHSFTVPRTGLYRVRMCGGGGAGSFQNDTLLDGLALEGGMTYPGRGGAAAAAAEISLDLLQGEECIFTVGDGGEARLPEHNTAPNEEGYDIEDLQAYLQNEDWISCGEASTFSTKSAGLLFTCEGGNPRRARARTFSNLPLSSALLTAEGKSKSADDESFDDWNFGCASALGQGGGTEDGKLCAPGYGGGGHGGALRLDSPLFTPVTLPGKGGCGVVLIEFVR